MNFGSNLALQLDLLQKSPNDSAASQASALDDSQHQGLAASDGSSDCDSSSDGHLASTRDGDSFGNDFYSSDSEKEINMDPVEVAKLASFDRIQDMDLARAEDRAPCAPTSEPQEICSPRSVQMQMAAIAALDIQAAQLQLEADRLLRLAREATRQAEEARARPQTTGQ